MITNNKKQSQSENKSSQNRSSKNESEKKASLKKSSKNENLKHGNKHEYRNDKTIIKSMMEKHTFASNNQIQKCKNQILKQANVKNEKSESGLDEYRKCSIFLDYHGEKTEEDTSFIRNQKNSQQPVKVIKRKPLILYHSDWFANLWNMVILVSLAYLCIMLPVTFVEDTLNEDWPMFQYLTLSVNIVFVLDIFVNFFSAQLDDYGLVVDSFAGIATRQLQGWFFIDFFSSIPFDLLAEWILGGGSQFGFLKQTRQLKILRVLKISRMTKIFKAIEQSEIQKNLQSEQGYFFNQVQKLAKSTFLMLICCHFFAQLLIGIYKSSENSFTETGIQEDNWVRLLFCPGDTADERSKCDMSQVLTYDIQAAAWYWAIQTVTTVGQGDIGSASSTDRAFRMLCMLVGVQVFSNFLASITQEPVETNLLDQEAATVKDKIDYIKRKYKLSGKCSLHLELLVTVSRNLELKSEYDLIEQLPIQKKGEVQQNMFENLKMKIKLFRDISINIFIDMFKSMSLQGKADSEQVQLAGEPPGGMQIINSGKCAFHEVLLNKQNILHKGQFSHLIQGELFGLADCLYSDQNFNDIQCLECSELFFISKGNLIKIIQKYDILSQFIKQASNNLIDQQRSMQATLFILKQLLEMGKHVLYCDILHLIYRHQLHTDYNLLASLKIFKDKKTDKQWWNPIIGHSFDGLIKNIAYKSATMIIDKFAKTLNKIRKRHQSIIDHSLLIQMKERNFEIEEDKLVQKKTGSEIKKDLLNNRVMNKSTLQVDSQNIEKVDVNENHNSNEELILNLKNKDCLYKQFGNHEKSFDLQTSLTKND